MSHKNCGGELRITRIKAEFRCFIQCLKCGKVWK